jgi:hypothetical protein
MADAVTGSAAITGSRKSAKMRVSDLGMEVVYARAGAYGALYDSKGFSSGVE